MRIHQLRSFPDYFAATERGDKPFEIRYNDRDFAEGDVIVLQEFDPTRPHGQQYTGRELRRVVSYLFRGGRFGLQPSWCVLGLREPAAESRPGR